jgi:hypothetical protein
MKHIKKFENNNYEHLKVNDYAILVYTIYDKYFPVGDIYKIGSYDSSDWSYRIINSDNASRWVSENKLRPLTDEEKMMVKYNL